MKINVYCTDLQSKVVTCTARYIGLFAGRRFGKTLGCIVPRIIINSAKPDFRTAYVGSTFTLARQIFTLLKNTCRPLIQSSPIQPTPSIQFWNGSNITFFSWNNAPGMRGWGYDEVVCDEIQEFNDENLFWSTMRPLISDRNGTLIVAGQFRGTDWRYKAFCEKGGNRHDGKAWQSESPKPGYKSFVFPAWLGPTYQGAKGRADLADAKEQLPRVVYQQEYECIPTANQACPFDVADLAAITRGAPPERRMAGRQYILSADLGYFTDPTKWIVLEMPTRMVVDAGAEPLRQKHEVTAQNLSAIKRKWMCSCAVIDATAGAGGGHHRADEFLSFYRKTMPDVRQFIWTRSSKRELYKLLSIWIEQHKLSIPEQFSAIIRELQTLEYKYHGNDYDINAQKGYHDDYPAALGMAVSMAERGLAGGASVDVAPG